MKIGEGTDDGISHGHATGYIALPARILRKMFQFNVNKVLHFEDWAVLAFRLTGLTGRSLLSSRRRFRSWGQKKILSVNNERP